VRIIQGKSCLVTMTDSMFFCPLWMIVEFLMLTFDCLLFDQKICLFEILLLPEVKVMSLKTLQILLERKNIFFKKMFSLIKDFLNAQLNHLFD